MKLLIACLLAGASLAAYAGHGGGAAGGMSSGHMSAAGLANTNSPNAADRDKGRARAEDRRSAAAAEHAHRTRGKGKAHRTQALLNEQRQ